MSETKEAAPQAVPEKPKMKKRWEQLKERLKKEKERQAYFERLVTDKPYQAFMQELDCEIDDEVLGLENTEKKDFDTNVANIKAKRWMLSRLRGLTSGAKVEDARRDLETFEKSEGLFIAAIKAGKDPEAEQPKDTNPEKDRDEASAQKVAGGEDEDYIFDAYDKIIHPLVNSNMVDEAVCNSANDKALLDAISMTLGDHGGGAAPVLGIWEFKGGKKPSIVCKPDNGGLPEKTFKGKELCERVRRYFVVRPDTTKAEEAVASDEGPKPVEVEKPKRTRKPKGADVVPMGAASA